MYNIVSMENNYCFKCGACCNKIAVDFSKRIIYRDGIQTLTKEFEAMLIPVEKREDITFCSCKFLKNKLCINPDKPQECTNYPSSPFAFSSGRMWILWFNIYKTRKLHAKNS